MKKIKVSVLMVLMVSLLTLGCGGGGASSVPVEKDVVGITSTLNDFMAASRSNDQAKLQSLLASPVEYYLKVKDFGPDITNPDDNKEYEFYVNSDLISQTSANEAHVYAYYILHSGEPYWLYFKMMRESGRWLIEEMANTPPQSGGYVEPIVPVTPPPVIPPVVPASEFVVASYNPLDNSIERIFAIENDVGVASITRLVSGYSPESADGDIVFYELYERYSDPGDPDYEGFVPSGASRRSLASSIVGGVRRNLLSSRLVSLRAQSEPDIQVYYGKDSQGAFWIKMVDRAALLNFNDGTPVKLFEPSHPYGTRRNISYPYISAGNSYAINLTIDIGYPISNFVTPLYSYAVVPLTFSSVDNNMGGAGEKWVEYHAVGVGEVGFDYYENSTSVQVTERNRLLTRFSGDGSINQRNDPIITNSSYYLGSYQAGQDIATTQVTASGGTAPCRSAGMLAALGLKPFLREFT